MGFWCKGTRTPGLLIRRSQEAIFIHSRFYEQSMFYAIQSYFYVYNPLHFLYCLHINSSIFQLFNVQKCAVPFDAGKN